jgi:ketosteroid isomerase-like protein
MTMFKMLTICIMAIQLISCYNPPKNNPEISDLTELEVRKFIERYDYSYITGDTLTLNKQMADEYIYFTSNGKLSTKEKSIAVFNPKGKYIIEKGFRDDIKVVVHGTTAIITSHWIGKGLYDSIPFNDNQRCGLVVQKQKDRIKIISEHCVEIVN